MLVVVVVSVGEAIGEVMLCGVVCVVAAAGGGSGLVDEAGAAGVGESMLNVVKSSSGSYNPAVQTT